MPDPTRVRSQPALNSGSGNTWLVVGALITALAGGIFVLALPLDPPGLALSGLLAVLALYAGMLIARFTILPVPVRMRTLAVLLLTLSVVALVCLGVIAWTQWSAPVSAP